MGTIEIECTIGNGPLVTSIRDGQRELSERVSEMLRPALEAMNNACAAVLALGYRPEQCEIVVERSSAGNKEKRTLEVIGKPCFEVTIEAKPIGPPDWTFEVVITPRVIAWRLPAPAAHTAGLPHR